MGLPFSYMLHVPRTLWASVGDKNAQIIMLQGHIY